MFISVATVNTASQYTYELNISKKIPTDGKLRLTFDPAYVLTVGSTIPCTATYGFASNAVCRVSAANVVEMTGAFPTTDFLLILKLQGIVNPAFERNFSTFVASYTSANLIIEQSGTTNFSFRTTPGLMTCTITNLESTDPGSGSDVVAEYTDVSVSFKVTNQVEMIGYFELGMAKWNSGTQTIGLETSILKYDATSFNPTLNGYSIPCTSSGHLNLKCTLKVAPVTTLEQISSSRDVLRVSGLSAPVSPGQTFIFQTTNKSFRNPPSTKPISTFQADSHRGDGSVIDQQTVLIKYKVNTAATILANQVLIRASTGEINQEQQFDFTVTLPFPLPVGAVFEITIPLEVSIYSDLARTQLILSSASGYAPLFSSPSVQVLDTSTQKIRVINLVPSSNYYVDSNNPFKFGLLQLKNPGSILATKEFSIAIYEEDFIIVNVDRKGLTFTAIPGILENLQIFPDNYKTRQAVPYEFSFETRNPLYVGGAIAIILPSQISVDSGKLLIKPLASVSLKNTITISWVQATRTVMIKNAFDAAIQPPTQVKFVLNGLINSFSTEPITPFIIRTADPFGEIIDEGTSKALEFTANEIAAIEATACADKSTASTTEEVCTYRLKFKMGAQYPILSGSSIQIKLPDDLQIPDASVTSKKSYTDGIGDLTTETHVSSDKRTVFFGGCFVQSSAPNGIDWRQDSFSVYIAGILTPRSTAPTLSFKAKILSSTNYVQYEKEQGVFSNVYQAKDFQNIGVYRTSVANGDKTGFYIFTVQFASVIYTNEYIKITPPQQIMITPDANQCIGITNLSENLSCIISDTSIYVVLAPVDPAQTKWNIGAQVKFQIGSITNPLSFELTDTFKIYVATSTSDDYYVNQIAQGMSITNTQAGAMTNVALLPESNELGAKTNYAIHFTITNILPIGSFVDIYFPKAPYPSLSSVTCAEIFTAGKNTSCKVKTEDKINNVIRVSSAFDTNAIKPNTEIGILLLGVINPKQSIDTTKVENQFQIFTVSPDGYSIDGASNLAFSIGCVFPCKTCDNGQANWCTTCLSLDNGTPLNLYKSASKQTCLAECPTAWYADKTNTCKQCDSVTAHCKTCSGSAEFCTSCDAQNPFLDTKLGLCNASCPAKGFFARKDTNTCEACADNCSVCNSVTDCTQCNADLFIMIDDSKGQCFSECPVTALEWPGAVKECKKCAEPCFTCKGTTDTCTTCITGFYLHESTCISECPKGYESNDKQMCFRASETIVPFVTMAGPLIFLLAVAISNAVDQRTKPITGFIALQNSWMIGFWIYQMVFLIKDGHKSSPIIIAFAILANYAINCMFYEYIKANILNGKDKVFAEHKASYPRTSKSIVNWSMLTSFQLFRFNYCGMCGSNRYLARFDNCMKYYKKINRYTLYQITFVYLPTMAASIYNLWYTWYGRQVFWINIECIGMGTIISILQIVVILRNQKEYVKATFDVGEFDEVQEAKLSSRSREKYLVDTIAKDLANDITLKGYRTEQHKKRILRMSNDQRKGTLRAIFDRMFATKQIKNEAIGFKLKHGRGLEVNQDFFGEDDVTGQQAYAAAGVAVKGYITEIPKSKTKKMMYSSVGDEDRRRANEIQEERKALEYQQFNGNDVTATMNDVSGTLGATQPLDTLVLDTTPRNKKLIGKKLGKRYQQIVNDTTQQDEVANPYDNEDQMEFKNYSQRNATLRMKGQDVNFDNIRRNRRPDDNDSEINYGITKEHYNFSSAPQNSKSALAGNPGLQERFDQFQKELVDRGVRQAHLMRTGEFNDAELAQRLRNDSMPIASQLIMTIEEDSDDAIENFDSNVWGKGTSKVIANHYNTVQQMRKIEKAETKAGLNNDGSKKLTSSDFKELITTLQACRSMKKQSKTQGAYIDIQRKELEVLVSAGKDEVEDLARQLKKLQAEIDAEAIRLQEVESKKMKDVAFVENAFYTSNEEGMGVSPNAYEGQNRMPRPGTRQRSPQREIPFGSDDLSRQILPNQRIVKNGKRLESTQSPVARFAQVEEAQSPAHFGGFGLGGSIHSDTGRSFERKSSKKKNKTVIKNGQLKHQPLNKDEDKYEYYTSEDEFGRRIQKMRKKKRRVNRKNDPSKERSKERIKERSKERAKNKEAFNPSSSGQNNLNAKLIGESGARGRSLTTQTAGQVQATFKLVNGSDSNLGGRGGEHERSQLFRKTGSAALEGAPSVQPRKKSKKKKPQPQVDYSGAYFNHSNFERAVIATNGRAPYNNKEVELITKREGFDPNSYAFKNNWVNNLMKSNSKSPRQHNSTNLTPNHHNSQVPSASVTATTIFQGLNPNERDSINNSAARNHIENDNILPVSGQMFHLLKNTLVNESPVTMMNMSEAGRNQIGVSEPLARATFGVPVASGANIDFFLPSSTSQINVTETSADNAMVLYPGHGAKKSRPPMPKTGFAGAQEQKPPSEGYFNATDLAQQDNIVVEEFGTGKVSHFTPQIESEQVTQPGSKTQKVARESHEIDEI